ncbi:hypothetical protein E2320_004435 [Naja naja]|nr:hypothetical protein E2320_004435 [Naja naja]
MIGWAVQSSPLFASFLAKLTTKTQNRQQETANNAIGLSFQRVAVSHLVPSRANAILAQTWQRKSTECEQESCATNRKDQQGINNKIFFNKYLSQLLCAVFGMDSCPKHPFTGAGGKGDTQFGAEESANRPTWMILPLLQLF